MGEASTIIPSAPGAVAPVATPAATGVPPVSAGAKPVAPVGGAQSPAQGARLPSVPDVKSTVIPHGGNSGGKPRKDGLVPGSPEAKEADRLKEAERSKQRRAAAKALEQSSPPVRLPPVATPPTGQASAPLDTLGSLPVIAVDDWKAEDFTQVGMDVVDLWETATVAKKRKRATGKLAPVVVEKICSDAAFPAPAKRSLQQASPAAIAKLFNWLKIPIAFKPAIQFCPALAYIIVRDFQQDAALEKMIAKAMEEAEAMPEAAKKTPTSKKQP